MKRIFLLGSEGRLIEEKLRGDVRIEEYKSEPIWCEENEREAKAQEYVAAASDIDPIGRIVAADYGPTPDGLGITVTVWFRTPNPNLL